MFYQTELVEGDLLVLSKLVVVDEEIVTLIELGSTLLVVEDCEVLVMTMMGVEELVILEKILLDVTSTELDDVEVSASVAFEDLDSTSFVVVVLDEEDLTGELCG